MKYRIWICQLLISVISSTITKSCKKDEIAKKDVVITWSNPADIVYGTPLSSTQLNATADVAGTFVYTPPIGTILNVGDAQYLKVDFTPDDVANYKSTYKTVQINVIVIHQFGTMTDQAGNVYKTITIGTQTWMAENLRTNKYRNLDDIDEHVYYGDWARITGRFCVYNLIPDNDSIYGKLYNWDAVNDSRNIAPTGWHVATDADWTTLIDYLGGNSVAGGKLKEKGTTHWNEPNVDATNESGFTALPGGGRNYGGGFHGINTYGCWWSATNHGNEKAWYYYTGNKVGCIYRADNYKECGYSVRCVKD